MQTGTFQCLNYLGNLGLRDQSRHAQVGKSCLMFQGQILANIKLSGQGFWAGFSSRAGGLLARYDKNESAAPLPLCRGCRLKHFSQMLPTFLGLGLEVTKHLFSASRSELSSPNLSSPVLLCTQPPPHLLLTVPQVPMNFCTFSLTFKVNSLHWTAGKNRIQNSQQLRPELMNLTFQAAQTKTFPQPQPCPVCSVTHRHRSLEGCPRNRLPYSAQSLLAVLHVAIRVILCSCSHAHPVLTCLFPLVSGVTLAWSSLIPLLCSSCALGAGTREYKHQSCTYL